MNRRTFLTTATATGMLIGTSAHASTVTLHPMLNEGGTALRMVDDFGLTFWTAEGLNGARSAVVDGLGQVWVADRGNHRVRVYDRDGAVLFDITTAEGTTLHTPSSVAVQDGRVAIADSGNHRVVLVDRAGTVHATMGSLEDSPRFNYPRDVAWDGQRRLHVLQSGDARVDVFARGQWQSTYGGVSAGKGGLSQPRTLDIDARSQSHIVDHVANVVATYSPGGELVGTSAL